MAIPYVIPIMAAKSFTILKNSEILKAFSFQMVLWSTRVMPQVEALKEKKT